jgi:hypothetical protein
MVDNIYEQVLTLLDQGKNKEEILSLLAGQEKEVNAAFATIALLNGSEIASPDTALLKRVLNEVGAVTETTPGRSSKQRTFFNSFIESFSMHKRALAGVVGALTLVLAVGAYMLLGTVPTSDGLLHSSVDVELSFDESSFEAEFAEIEALAFDDLDVEETLLALIDLDLTDDAFEESTAAEETITAPSGDAELDGFGMELEGELDAFLEELGDLTDFDETADDVNIESLS